MNADTTVHLAHVPDVQAFFFVNYKVLLEKKKMLLYLFGEKNEIK